MELEQQQVKDFMLKAGQECPKYPGFPSFDVRMLREKLIREELNELYDAMFITENMTEVYDAILDLLVVTIGCANAFGLTIDPGWAEVHRSNMSKFIDGHKREDGKWIKGPSFVAPKLGPIIEAMEPVQKEFS